MKGLDFALSLFGNWLIDTHPSHAVRHRGPGVGPHGVPGRVKDGNGRRQSADHHPEHCDCSSLEVAADEHDSRLAYSSSLSSMIARTPCFIPRILFQTDGIRLLWWAIYISVACQVQARLLPEIALVQFSLLPASLL